MKKRFLIIAMFAALMLSGCTKVIELSSEEEDLIAEYVATQFINNYKKTIGLIPADKQEQTPAVDDATQATEGVTVPEGMGETESTQESTEPDPAMETVALEQALGLKGVELEMIGYSVEDSYPKETIALVVEAPKGRKLLVIEYDVWNSVDAESVMEMNPENVSIKAVINGTTKCNLYKTMLKEDIMNMNGTEFQPGEARTGVLIFTVEEENAQEIQTVSISVSAK